MDNEEMIRQLEKSGYVVWKKHECPFQTKIERELAQHEWRLQEWHLGSEIINHSARIRATGINDPYLTMHAIVYENGTIDDCAVDGVYNDRRERLYRARSLYRAIEEWPFEHEFDGWPHWPRLEAEDG